MSVYGALGAGMVVVVVWGVWGVHFIHRKRSDDHMRMAGR